MIWRRGLYDCNTAQGDWNSESSEHFIKNLGNLNSFSTVPFREQNRTIRIRKAKNFLMTVCSNMVGKICPPSWYRVRYITDFPKSGVHPQLRQLCKKYSYITFDTGFHNSTWWGVILNSGSQFNSVCAKLSRENIFVLQIFTVLLKALGL